MPFYFFQNEWRKMGKTNYFMKLALICGVTFILSLCAGVMWTHKDHNKMYVYVNNLSKGQTHVENTVSYKNVAFHCVRRIYIKTAILSSCENK